MSETLEAATCLSINIGKALAELARQQGRVADAINRLADVYLYVNDPEGEEGPAPTNLPEGFRGMR